MILLTKRQILLLHEQLIAAYGGSSGVRDDGLLESAINAPLQTFGGIEFYPTVIDKSVRLCFGLIRNHPFIDGNKRIGAHAMLTQLAINGINVDYEDEEFIEVILEVAAGVLSQESLHDWVTNHLEKN